jgi:hypothetical protein
VTAHGCARKGHSTTVRIANNASVYTSASTRTHISNHTATCQTPCKATCHANWCADTQLSCAILNPLSCNQFLPASVPSPPPSHRKVLLEPVQPVASQGRQAAAAAGAAQPRAHQLQHAPLKQPHQVGTRVEARLNHHPAHKDTHISVSPEECFSLPR